MRGHGVEHDDYISIINGVIMPSYYYGLIESKIYLLETEIKEKTEELKRLKDLKNHYDEMNEYNE